MKIVYFKARRSSEGHFGETTEKQQTQNNKSDGDGDEREKWNYFYSDGIKILICLLTLIPIRKRIRTLVPVCSNFDFPFGLLQPYRTTPLILPGAKVKKEYAPNDCYLRHHPNPSMRGRNPHVDDNLWRSKQAESALHRVVGEDARSGRVAHKQFNSPIGLYSDNNVEHMIRSTVPNAQP